MSASNELELRIRMHERQLAQRFGNVVCAKDLARLLGYSSDDAFRQAAHRKKLPFATFLLPGRRGRFARLRDVAEFLAKLDSQVDASRQE